MSMNKVCRVWILYENDDFIHIRTDAQLGTMLDVLKAIRVGKMCQVSA